MYLLYSFILTAAAVLSSPYWVFKAVRERKYFANFRQRLGIGLAPVPQTRPPLWIHAVSVGEVLAAKPLVAAIRAAHPDIPIVVSTVTITGQNLARTEFPHAQRIFYFPFDWSFCVGRFLRAVRPKAVVILETELWPNFLRQCRAAAIPVFLVNGRISEKSNRRYRIISGLTRKMLSQLRAIGAQSNEDRRRFVELGASDEQVRTTGNLKYDFPPPVVDRSSPVLEAAAGALRLSETTPVIVVGSSMRSEEAFFIEVFRTVRQRIPGARLILAPRHPERFDEVEDLLLHSGLPFVRRTAAAPGGREAEILLLDTIGELRSAYTLAWVAVIGGSFLWFGGHNLLEPASLGKAVVIGPGMSNFRDMARLFVREQAVRQCAPEELAQSLVEILSNERARTALGQRASLICKQNQGAAGNTLSIISSSLD
jgi:3-deoxy-D-manno-octulosonic-acid transferase